MPHFGKTSNSRLITCHPDLVLVATEVIQIFDYTILYGHRNKEEQNKMYFANPRRSKLRWPRSKHNKWLSWAMDVAPWYKKPPHVRWPDMEDRPDTYGKELAAFYVLATMFIIIGQKYGIKIRSGMDWDMNWDFQDQSFDDLPHIELKGL